MTAPHRFTWNGRHWITVKRCESAYDEGRSCPFIVNDGDCLLTSKKVHKDIHDDGFPIWCPLRNGPITIRPPRQLEEHND